MPADYTNMFTTTATPTLVFEALTQQIDSWWTTAANKACDIDDELRVKFGNNTYKVMRVVNAYPGKSLTWEVIEAHIGHEELSKKDEWLGTRIHWFIRSEKVGSQVELIHQGLTTDLECWQACSKGWDYFLASLSLFLNSGEGTPFQLEA